MPIQEDSPLLKQLIEIAVEQTYSAVLTGVQGEHKGHYLRINKNQLVIGIDPESDVPFSNDIRISPRHALLFKRDDYWYCADLGSLSGTFVNQQRVGEEPLLVVPGAMIYCGRQAMRLDYVRPGNPPQRGVKAPAIAPSAAPAAPDRPEAVIDAAWIPPGKAVKVQTFTIPGGMIYVGKGLPAVNGRGTEPALIAPHLKISTRQPRLDSFDYWTTYATATPARRRLYLEWLAGGRKGTMYDEGLLLLFFYGIERRILEKQGKDVPDDEMRAIKKELQRLIEQYGPTMYSFRSFGHRLLEYMDLLALLKRPDLPTSAEFAGLERRPTSLPPPFEVTLARMAQAKIPLPADFAYRWFQLDPEYSPRSVVTRCPDEMHRLFLDRFAKTYPGGLRLTTLKATVALEYQPISRSFAGIGTQRAITEGEARLNRISLTPLKRIHEIADGCALELDAFSRWVGRNTEDRDALPGVGLLPDLLFFEHPAVQSLQQWLTQNVLEAEFAVLPAIELLNMYLGRDRPMSKQEGIVLLRAIERLGYLVEPDIRFGGMPLDPAGKIVIAKDTHLNSGGEPLDNLQFAALLPQIQMIAVAAAPEPEIALSPLRWRRAAARLMQVPRMIPATRLRGLARLRYLLETPASNKPPRKQVVNLTPEERRRMSEIIVSVVNLEGEGITLAKTKEMSRLFRLLEEDEATLYSRLHNISMGSDDDLPLLTQGKPGGGFAIPAPQDSPKGSTLGIDMAMVERKAAESAVVSALLAEVFTENEPQPAVSVLVSETISGSRLDQRHQILLRRLLEEDEWTTAEFAALAREQNLLPGGAMEKINDAAWDAMDEAALEEEDTVRINRAVAEAIL